MALSRADASRQIASYGVTLGEMPSHMKTVNPLAEYDLFNVWLVVRLGHSITGHSIIRAYKSMAQGYGQYSLRVSLCLTRSSRALVETEAFCAEMPSFLADVLGCSRTTHKTTVGTLQVRICAVTRCSSFGKTLATASILQPQEKSKNGMSGIRVTC